VRSDYFPIFFIDMRRAITHGMAFQWKIAGFRLSSLFLSASITT